MAENMGVYAELSAKDKNFTKTMNEAVGSAERLSDAGEQAAVSVGKIAKGQIAAQIVTKAFNVLTGSIGKAIDRLDTMNNYPRVMESLGYTAEEAQESIERLGSGIEGLPTTLDEIVSNTQLLTASLGDLDKGTDTAIALNNMFLAGGQGAEAASRALTQYNQILSKGKVDQQSWNTMVEVAPGQMNQLAQSLLGASAKASDLYAALSSGEISLNEFNNSIIKLNEQGGEGFASFADQALAATGGIGTAITNLGSAVTKGIASMVDAIDKGLQNAGLPSIAEQLNGLKQVINTVFSGISTAISAIMPAFKWLADNIANVGVAVLSLVAGFATLKIINKVKGWSEKLSKAHQKSTDRINAYTKAINKYGSAEKAAEAAQKSAIKAENLRTQASKQSEKAARAKAAYEEAATRAAEASAAAEKANGENERLNAEAKEAAAVAASTKEEALRQATAAQQAETAATKQETAAAMAAASATAADVSALSTKEILMGVLSGKIGMATAAQEMFNRVVLANPIGFIITAITTLISTISMLTAWLGDQNKEFKEQQERWEDLRTEIDETIKVMDEFEQQADSERLAFVEQKKAVSDCMDVIKEYANRAVLTEAEQSKLGSAVAELNGYLDEEVASVDEVTGLLKDEYDALKDTVDMHLKASESAMSEEQLTDAVQKQYEAETKRADLLKEMAKQEKALAEEEKYNAMAQEACRKAGQAYVYVQSQLSKEYELNKQKLSELEAELETYPDTVENTAERVSNAKRAEAQIVAEQAQKEATAQEQAAKQAEEAMTVWCANAQNVLKTAVNNHTATLDNLSQKNQETVSKLTDTWETYKDATTEMFEQLSSESSISTDEMIANLQHNQEIVAQMGDNMAGLRDRFLSLGLDEAILDQFAEMGPEAAGYISELTSASDEQLSTLANTYEQGGTLAWDRMTQSMGSGADAAAEKVKYLAANTTDSLRSALESANWGEIGENVVESYTESIEDGEGKAISAGEAIGLGTYNGANSIIQEGSPSKTFTSMGNNIVLGLIRGLNTNNTAPASAMKRICDGVVNAAETIISRLNEIGTMAGIGFANGLSSTAWRVQSTAQSIADKASSTISNALKVGSPSRVMRQIGEWTGEGFAIGIESTGRAVARAADAIADKASMISPADWQGQTRYTVQASLASGAVYEMEDLRSEITSLKDALINKTITASGDLYIDGAKAGKIMAPSAREEINRLDRLANLRQGVR